MSERKIVVISAGLSTPSSTRMLADRLLNAALEELSEKGIETTTKTFELRDYAHQLTDNMLAGFAPKELESMLESVYEADALIAVTPIFSTSYSGLFKMFIDVLDPDRMKNKVVLLGANAGTARHSLAIDYAIRPIFAYLHSEVVSTGVFAASSDWGDNSDSVAPLGKRIASGAKEFANAIAAKEPLKVLDPFDPESYLGGGQSFSHLLGGLAGK